MTNAVDRSKTDAEDECRHYSWLEDYLEELEGKEIRSDLQAGGLVDGVVNNGHLSS